jgi:hypothetical protein
VRNDRGCVLLPTDRRDLDMQPLVELQRDVDDVEQLGAFGFRKAVLRRCRTTPVPGLRPAPVALRAVSA